MHEADPDNEATYHVQIIKSDIQEIRIPQAVILKELQAHSFSSDAIFGIKLALEEALANAVCHGNSADDAKDVTVRFAINADKAIIIIRDEGPGFEPDDIPDPTTPARLRVPCGRGIMLIKAYMDEVKYRDQGREVYLVKYRT